MFVRRWYAAALPVSVLAGVLIAAVSPAAAVGTAFTYQGQLLQNGTAINGTCDLQFNLFTVPVDGMPIGATVTDLGRTVSNGLFTAPLDFGAVFDGGDRYLEIATRCPAGAGAFVTLQPRQPLTAVPYALGLALPLTSTTSSAGPAVSIANTNTGSALHLSNGSINVTSPTLSVETSGFGGVAIHGDSTALSGGGVRGTTAGAVLPGVEGRSTAIGGIGVLGRVDVDNGIAIRGEAPMGPSGKAISGFSLEGFAGYFDGKVQVISPSSAEDNAFVVSLELDRVARIDSTGRGFFNGGTQNDGADVAEFILIRDGVEPGDVVEIDPERPNHFRRAMSANSTAVAGVISTDPGVSLNAKNAAMAEVTGPQLALVGRVPVKVTDENGPIRPGDLLVASSTPGHAMRGPSNPAPGTVVGKALTRLDGGVGVTEMLVMLR